MGVWVDGRPALWNALGTWWGSPVAAPMFRGVPWGLPWSPVREGSTHPHRVPVPWSGVFFLQSPPDHGTNMYWRVPLAKRTNDVGGWVY